MSKGRSRSSSDYRGSRGRNLYDDLANKKKEKPYYVGEGHIPDRVYKKHKH